MLLKKKEGWMQVEEIEEFMLGEGVDKTGVGTKILTCNCTMNVIVDNHSKLFGLHILPPSLHMSFGPLPIATSQVSPHILYYLL